MKKGVRDVAHDDVMAETFRQDPVYAIQLTIDILEDREDWEIDILLRQLKKAFRDSDSQQNQ